MKNKELNKLTKKLEEVINLSIKDNFKNTDLYTKRYDGDLKSDDDYKLAEYNVEVSEKFKKLVMNLLTYSENISINVNDNRIAISTGDLKAIKSSNYKSNVISNEEHYLELVISKEHSFHINRGYTKRSNYKDTEMYNYLFPIVTAKLQEINSNNFNEIWNEIMKDSGMLRDNNLDDLLND